MGKEEAAVQTSIINYLVWLGAWVVKTIATTKNGTPDVLACLNGRFIGIEVKKPGGKASPLQKVQLRKIKEAGGLSITADNLNDVKIMLESSGILK